jgi:hypothetical protein
MFLLRVLGHLHGLELFHGLPFVKPFQLLLVQSLNPRVSVATLDPIICIILTVTSSPFSFSVPPGAVASSLSRACKRHRQPHDYYYYYYQSLPACQRHLLALRIHTEEPTGFPLRRGSRCGKSRFPLFFFNFFPAHLQEGQSVAQGSEFKLGANKFV